MARNSGSKIWSVKADKRAKRNDKAPTDVDSVLQRTRVAILRNQQQLALTLFDLMENVETILKLPDRDSSVTTSSLGTGEKSVFDGQFTPKMVKSLLGEVGIFPRDIRLIQQLSKALKGQENLLVARSVSIDTIRALAFTTDDARVEALTRIGAGAKLGPLHVSQIEREFKQSALTDEERQLLSYRKELNRVANKFAKEQTQNDVAAFRLQMRQFLLDYEGHQTWREEIAEWSVALDEGYDESDLDMEDFYASYDKLTMDAQALFVRFERLFPNAFIPMEDWLSLPPDSAKLMLAQARHLLSQASQGPSFFPLSVATEFANVDGHDILWKMCGGRDRKPQHLERFEHSGQPAVVGRKFDKMQNVCNNEQESDEPKQRMRKPEPVTLGARNAENLIRRLTAIDIFSASGAGALGLEDASFRVLAVSDEDVQARETIRSNRADWGIAKTASLADIRAAIPPKMKNRQINVVCGALPGRPWHLKQKGAADERNSLDKVKSVLKGIRPDGFFFENADGFLDTRHALHKNKMIEDLSALGYQAEFFELDGRNCGLPQTRKRAVLMGVKRCLNKRMVPPVFQPSLNRSLDHVLQHWSQSQPSQCGQETHLRWSTLFKEKTKGGWIERKPTEYTPDVYTLTTPNSQVLRGWRKAGIEPCYLTSPNKRRRDKFPTIELTVPIAKALQGIPSDWQITGSEAEQLHQICLTTPPVVMRLMAQAMHATLTGQTVDLSKSCKAPLAFFPLVPLASGEQPVETKRFHKLPPLHFYDDPQGEKIRRHRTELKSQSGPLNFDVDEAKGQRPPSPEAAGRRLQFLKLHMSERVKKAKEEAKRIQAAYAEKELEKKGKLDNGSGSQSHSLDAIVEFKRDLG